MTKVTKATQLRDKSVNELREEKLQLQRGLFNLRMQKATGQLAKSHQFNESRKQIARINTVLGEMKEGGK